MADTHTTLRTLRKPNAVLFDWDNTLMDHDEHTMPVIERMIQELGRPPYPAGPEINAAWGKDPQTCCDLYFPGHTPKDIQRYFYTALDDHDPEHVPLIPGARDLLDALKAKGVQLALVSNKPEDRLRREVEKLGLTGYFAAIRGDRGDGTLKPNPAIVMQTLQEMRVPHGNNWFVGDMIADLGAARSDGFQRFMVGTRHRDKAHVQSYGADPAGRVIYLDSIADMLTFAQAIPGGKGFLTP